ncbi:hypothetical protein L484_003249 [Morus notabilis]|uniref:Uncharacterized protein n=1 Tax=Morus notabilis TaxID=981085 RepID=W9RKF2_9ROSA|nr:hypothetical protein L484_003249 [Morus notabilis]
MVQLFPSLTRVGKERSSLLAPTVKIHGDVFCTVCGLGPEFPAAHTTATPFATAWNAPTAIAFLWSASGYEGTSAAIETDTTSTPSRTDTSNALSMSAPAHNPPPNTLQQTLYIAIRACVAPPLTVPTPNPL